MRVINKSFALTTLGVIAIAGAFVYVGYRISQLPSEERVTALIEEKLGTNLTEAQIKELIDKQLNERKTTGGLSESAFNARAEKAIIAFIQKQQRAEQERPNQLAKNVPRPTKSDHVYGNPDAVVTLIEYSDFECPYCKQFHIEAKRLVDNSNGKVNWVYRHFPLDFHNPGAQKQAEASECVAQLGGNKAFWTFTDAIYQRTRAGGKGFPLENLVPLAAEVGVNAQEFKQCYESGRMAARVEKDFAAGAAAGITGTPGNILLHRKTDRVQAMHGAVPYSQLQAGVERLINPK